MAKKVTVYNPRKNRGKARSGGVAPRRRRRRRKNPSMHPALKALLATGAGAAGGAGAGIGLRYTNLSTGMRALVEGLGGIGLGLGLAFVDPSLGAGVGAGMASIGLMDGIAHFMADVDDETASEQAAGQMTGVYYQEPAQLGIGAVTYDVAGLDSKIEDVMAGRM